MPAISPTPVVTLKLSKDGREEGRKGFPLPPTPTFSLSFFAGRELAVKGE